MKKIISLVLVLVLVFSLAVPSFAYPHSDTELEALNEIEYWTYWIHQDFTGFFTDTNEWLTSIWQVLTLSIAANIENMETDLSDITTDVDSLASRSESVLSNLLDVNEYLRSVNDEISSLNDKLFGDLNFLQPFAQTIGANSNTIVSKLTTLESDIAQLKEVLADDEDLAFKESQKENQQYIQDTFFKPGSDLSLNVSELTDFTTQFTDFTDSFDFIEKVGTSTSPLESISEGSDFSQWFTNETGQDMDPTFGGGSGGGGETPDPDEPDPDEPDPPTPTIKNWLPLATTEPGGSEIYNGKGWKPSTRWVSGSHSVADDPSGTMNLTGWIPVVAGDTIFTFDIFFEQNNYYSNYYVQLSNGSYTSIRINDYSFDENGVSSFSVPSNVQYVRFSCTDISDSSVISINQYPIQTTSTFSLRASTVPYEPEIVTSAYSDRMNEFYKLLGGDE